MTLLEYNTKKNSLKSIFLAAEQELKSFNNWKVINSDDWKLKHIGINNDGSLTAVVKWTTFIQDQWVGLSWENIIKRIELKTNHNEN